MLFHSLGVILKGVLLSYGCPLAQLTFPSPPSGAWMGKLILAAPLCWDTPTSRKGSGAVPLRVTMPSLMVKLELRAFQLWSLGSSPSALGAIPFFGAFGLSRPTRFWPSSSGWYFLGSNLGFVEGVTTFVSLKNCVSFASSLMIVSGYLEARFLVSPMSFSRSKRR